jgi:hypothetical protein
MMTGREIRVGLDLARGADVVACSDLPNAGVVRFPDAISLQGSMTIDAIII